MLSFNEIVINAYRKQGTQQTKLEKNEQIVQLNLSFNFTVFSNVVRWRAHKT